MTASSSGFSTCKQEFKKERNRQHHLDQFQFAPSFRAMLLTLTLTNLSGMSSSLGPPISSSSSSFFFFWFLSCFSFSAFFFSSSSWAFFWALRCLFLSFFSSLSERLATDQSQNNGVNDGQNVLLYSVSLSRTALNPGISYLRKHESIVASCSSPVSACSSLLSSVSGLS